jgi:D-glycero-beta-D-manno-heptose 1-phosphate adenylyltransferase
MTMHTVGNISELQALVREWKTSGETIVFTNGVFDILHIGHVTYLEKAKSLGDRLVVGINADDSVRRLNKGPDRPVNPEQARAQIIAALRCVDAVIIFHEDTPLEIIRDIMPDILVKGGDYDPKETDPLNKRYIVGSDLVYANGGKVEAIDLVQGYSTTSIIEKMQSGK